jgi:hypothetical protein
MSSSINSSKIIASLLTVSVLGLSLLTPSYVRAQVAGATLSGTVTDTSGAVIPGAQVAVKNVGTGISAQVPTNADGFYSVPNLIPGTYELAASASGFATMVQKDITLTVGAQQVLNFSLRVGQATQQVEVTGVASAVELASSAIKGVVGSTTVVELPLNGRSWTDLASLQPGVNALTTQASYTTAVDRGLRGFGAEISISGARPQQNNYRLDGVSLNDYGNGGPGSVIGGNLGVDAIQEFSVLTTNYSAEYGKTAGGVVNAILRSGTNQFHGSAYEFLRNASLDARNFFDYTSPNRIPPFRRNQFGGSAGGPIQKDRTFIFGDFEAIRQTKGISVLDIVPSAAAHAGNLCSNLTPPFGAPGDCTPNTVPVDPSVQKYLPLFPLPNAGLAAGGDGNTGFFSFAGNQVVSENFFTTRIDHKFSEKDSLFGSYMFDRTPFNAPDTMNNVLKNSLTARHLISLEETHIFSPRLVNTVRLGYNRVGANIFLGVSAINPAAGDDSLSAQPGRDAAAVIIGGGLTEMPGGILAPSSSTIGWNSIQAYDDAFLTHGTHALKFGFAFERMQLNRVGASLPGGVFTFSSLTDFLTNVPKKFQSGLIETLTGRGYRQTLLGGYLQDDWRWRSNLTLNLGLRYEMVTVPTEVQDKLANLNNLTDSAQRLGNPLFNNPTLRNFEPRVGFAWDPFKNGKTAVHGGFGVFDSLPLLYQVMLVEGSSAPFFLKGTVKSPHLPPGSFFAGAAPLLQPTGVLVPYYDQNPKRNYVMQWNLNVQREITPSLAALVGYVGSRGVHMPYEVDDLDMVIPTLTPAGYLFPNPVGNGNKINPNFGAINGVFYKGDSYYNALAIGLTKRMSHGLQFQASYTWSKSIDTSSATMQGDQFTNGITSLNWWDPRLTRGLSDFNVPRTFVVSATWQLPKAGSLSGPAGWLVNGWQLGGILKLSDGMPYSATWGTGSDPAGIGNSDDYAFPNVLTGPGCKTLVNPGNPDHYVKTQCFAIPTAPSFAFFSAPAPAGCDPAFGSTNPSDPNYLWCFNLRGNAARNIIPGPGIQTLDFSVFKDSPIRRISETFKVQFRAEFFNILNHPNFGDPNIANAEADLFDGSGAPIGTVGKLTTTTTTAREIQFALKLIW